MRILDFKGTLDLFYFLTQKSPFDSLFDPGHENRLKDFLTHVVSLLIEQLAVSYLTHGIINYVLDKHQKLDNNLASARRATLNPCRKISEMDLEDFSDAGVNDLFITFL